MIQSDIVLKSSKEDRSMDHSTHSANASIFAVRNSLANVSNVVYHSPTMAPAGCNPVDDLCSPWSRPHSTFHVNRVATVDCHDMCAWSQEPKAHYSDLYASVASSSLDPNRAAPDDCPLADATRNQFHSMDFRTQEHWIREQCLDDARLHEDCIVRPRVPFVASGPRVSPVGLSGTTGLRSHEDLSEGRRRVGEILARCGVIDVSGIPAVESVTAKFSVASTAPTIEAPLISNAATKRRSCNNERHLTRALANWTSEWLRTLIIQPYLEGGFRFQYYGKSSASSSIVSRIFRVLNELDNPLQVVIHTLWFVGILTGNGTHENTPFLSVPFFRYLHNNGTFIAEDFMFRTFVACAMIGDKTVNDATLSTTTWNRSTRIPQVILNAAERYALSRLNWNTVMTRTQWQDMVIYFRSCIKMGSTFDPFAYDETSSTGIMARYLDELIDFSCMGEGSQQEAARLEIIAPRPIRHSTHWKVFDAVEWCPEDDPVVNQKPRTIGIAPGTDGHSCTIKVGTTAKDLLDSILGSSNIPDLAHLGRPAGTSFCGSFGSIGARLAHTVKLAGSCHQNASWVHTHGYITT